MRDIRRSDGYRQLVLRTGLDPSVSRAVEVAVPGIQDGQCHCLRVGQSLELLGFGIVRYLAERLDDSPVVELPEGVEVSGFWLEPTHMPKLAAAPATAEEYWRRVDAMTEAIGELGERLTIHPAVENGWLPVMEAVVAATLQVMTSGDTVHVCTKSKFGTMRVSASVATDPTDEARARYFSDVAQWAEAVTEGRCEAFGIPGWSGPLKPGKGGWIYTLSDEARSLSSDALRRRIHPPRPADGGHE